MKEVWNRCKESRIWFCALFVTDILFIIFLWLVNAQGFSKVSIALLLGTFLIYGFVVIFSYQSERRRERAFREFLENPDALHEQQVLEAYGMIGEQQIRAVGEKLREGHRKIHEQNLLTYEYEQYVETWVHEIKTPIALLTFVLDNREEEMSPEVHKRLEHIRSQMREDVERMLYYARTEAHSVDYLIEKLSLKECCEEALEEYQMLLWERGFVVENQVGDIVVDTDKRGLAFILNQIISNAVKYAKTEEAHPKLILSLEKSKDSYTLAIRDNGVGVRQYDLPFLFQKGFTGESGAGRKKATGMGLYLSKKVADALGIKIEVEENCQDGFGICLIFPINL